MLEYAAHARRSWDADDLRGAFEAQPDWEGRIRMLLDSDGAPDADTFWRSVKTNLRAANLRLLLSLMRYPSRWRRSSSFSTSRFARCQRPRRGDQALRRPRPRDVRDVTK